MAILKSEYTGAEQEDRALWAKPGVWAHRAEPQERAHRAEPEERRAHHAFSVVGPMEWNALSVNVWTSRTRPASKRFPRHTCPGWLTVDRQNKINDLQILWTILTFIFVKRPLYYGRVKGALQIDQLTLTKTLTPGASTSSWNLNIELTGSELQDTGRNLRSKHNVARNLRKEHSG